MTVHREAPEIGLPGGMSLVDPLQRAGWDDLVSTHPDCSFFHGTAWARVLHESYGHSPVFICQESNGRLQSLLPLMEVSSPLTGRRGVSLPFSDFCQPLTSGKGDCTAQLDFARELGQERRWKYLEWRSGLADISGARPSRSFLSHILDLVPETDRLYDGLADPMRRGLRKAMKAGVRVKFTTDHESIRSFYGLHCRTRRRHGLPPQPFRFFENIGKYAIEPGHGWVVSAVHRNRTIAAAIFFHHGSQALYKYGASDPAFQHLRPNNLLIWEAIKWYATCNCKSLHFGRTDRTHEGLRRFKSGFGAREEQLDYCRYDCERDEFVSGGIPVDGWFNQVFRWQPLPVLRLAGRLLYRHLS